MKILYYECFAGISGDMNLAAMLALGLDEHYLRAELAKLGLSDQYTLHISHSSKMGIHGIRVDVECAHQHHHRTLIDIKEIIENSRLSARVKKDACGIFSLLAEAEASVHGTTADEVHFHEVGAIDSIVDIVGAAIAYDYFVDCFGIDALWCSTVELGGGMVRCAHGMMPVPAPATAHVLAQVPTSRGAVQKECTTPTGAAIIKYFALKYTDKPQFSLEKTAYGIGHRDMDIPNVLRVNIAELEEYKSLGRQRECVLLECNIDDMTAEHLSDLVERAMDLGAMDIHLSPIIMKKGRPATCVSLLCEEKEEGQWTEFLLRNTTSLGVKSFPHKRTELERKIQSKTTILGEVKVKYSFWGQECLRAKPEYEDCKALAKKHGITLAEVYKIIGQELAS